MQIDMAKEEIADKAYELPKLTSAIYFLLQGEEIVYIGQSKRFPLRIRAHIGQNKIQFDRCYHIPCPVEELKATEYDLICEHKPKYNRFLYLKEKYQS